jgi:hypothetical protein
MHSPVYEKIDGGWVGAPVLSRVEGSLSPTPRFPSEAVKLTACEIMKKILLKLMDLIRNIVLNYR